jgi:hypothetical protein
MEKTFSETSSRLESQMGRIDHAAFTKLLSEGESAMAVRAHIQGTEGPLGLIFSLRSITAFGSADAPKEQRTHDN